MGHAARRAPGRTARPGDFTTDRRVLLLVAMALVVGIASTIAALALIKLIALVTNLIWFGRFSFGEASPAMASPSLWMVLVPAIGGLVIGLMARFGSEKIRGHGIPEAIEAILIGGSRMSLKVAILKPISSAISIGTGGPFGAEGPIIMTGGSLGSLFAQCFSMTAAERKTLLVAGAAAGMTAIFGTPAAAVMLAVELLLFELKPRSLIPVIAAAAVAAALRPVFFDSGPLFPFEMAAQLPAWGLIAAAGVGIIAGLQSGLLTMLLYKAEDLFERLPIHWMWWPALGGLFVGLGGFIEPRALGVGYDVIGDLLSGEFALAAVVSILAVKAVIWVVALASGTSGGVLAPLLILGGAMGWLLGQVLPGEAGFWALLGMAAMMGGTMRSPITGVLFALELTGDLSALLPLLIATASAYAVTVLLLKRSILTEKIARRGQHITREYSVDPFELMQARDVMVTKVDVLRADMTIGEAAEFLTASDHRHRSYPVVDAERRVVGMVGRGNVLAWRGDAAKDQTLYDKLSDAETIVGHPDDPLGLMADMMIENDTGRIPVVSRQTRQIEGLVSRKDILRLRTVRRLEEMERSGLGTTRPAKA